MRKVGASTLKEYIFKARGRGEIVGGDLEQAILQNTAIIAEETVNDPRYSFGQNSKEPRKINSHLFVFDCLSCDKCVPVCPNDANFIFEVEPVRLQYRDYRLTRGSLLPDESHWFSIDQAHQLANFADFCNECGNCDTFCPEYGGPFIEKPGFFGSRESFEGRPGHDGFYVERDGDTERIVGRIKGQTHRLEISRRDDQATFNDGTVQLSIQPSTGKLLSWKALDPVLARVDPAREPYSHTPDHVVSMVNYYRMETLLRGVLDTKRVHYVNAAYM